MAGAPDCLRPATVKAKLMEKSVDVLIDSGASGNFIVRELAAELKLPIKRKGTKISMASQGLTTITKGTVRISISLLDREYELEFDVMERRCADVILGQSFLSKHSEVSFVMEGSDASLKIKQEHVLSVAAANVKPPRLFKFLSSDCKPIACRPRQYSKEELKYIDEEIERLLKADIIEPSRSPWRAQVLVVNKKLLVIDYSTTINRFTNLDSYPLFRIEALVNTIASVKYYSSIDLRSAYHQIPLKEKERIYTSLEACGRLYQYKRLPFGVKNGVSAFQRVIDDFIKQHKLKTCTHILMT